MTLLWSTATEDEVVQHCSRSNPNRDVISELEGGHSIVKISNDVVVKCGFGVTEFEAANQRRAHEILDPDIIRVPRVYRYFSQECTGYLIMEYIKGQPVSSTADPDEYLEPMIAVLQAFEDVRQDKPGPFSGSTAYGQLWLDYAPIAPTSVTDIEAYFNRRQLKNRTQMCLSGLPLVFCHLDIAPRNILVQEDGSLGLVDWASAGFYPRFFERTVIEVNIRGTDDWNSKLLRRLEELDEAEKLQAQLLEKAFYLAQKYS